MGMSIYPREFPYYEHVNNSKKGEAWVLLLMDGTTELAETWSDASLSLVDVWLDASAFVYS